MPSVYILLPADAADAASEFAFAQCSDGSTVEQHGAAPAALLPAARGAGAEVVAIVPAAAVSWHRVELPPGVAPNTPRLRSVLEGLLEEQLLDEPDALHFAVGRTVQGRAWVAVCNRAWLRGALQVLESAGRPVSRIVPELVPDGALTLDAFGDADHPLLAATSDDGVLILPLHPGSLALLPPLAEDTPCLAEPAVVALAEQVLQHRVTVQQAPQRWLRAAASGWDLAQFDFANTGRARAFKTLAGGWSAFLRAPQWRAARWGALALIAAQLIGLNAWAWKEHRALQAKRAAVQSTLATTFPNVKVVVDAPVQMEREVAALRQATGVASGRDLEAMLAALAMAAPPGRSVSGLEYNNGELRVRGLGLAPDEAQPVNANLRSQGYAGALQGDVLVISQETTP